MGSELLSGFPTSVSGTTNVSNHQRRTLAYILQMRMRIAYGLVIALIDAI